MDLQSNVGRFIAVLSIGPSSVLAILERHPKKQPPNFNDRFWNGKHWEVPEEWTHHFALRALERFPPSAPLPEIVERTGRILTTGDLKDDVSFYLDATSAGDAALRLVRGLRVPATCLRAGAVAETYDPLIGVRTVPIRDLTSAVSLTLQERRFEIAQAMPHAHGILAELARIEGDLPSPTVRALAFAMWSGRRSSSDAMVSRKEPAPGTPEHFVMIERQTQEDASRAERRDQGEEWEADYDTSDALGDF